MRALLLLLLLPVVACAGAAERFDTFKDGVTAAFTTLGADLAEDLDAALADLGTELDEGLETMGETLENGAGQVDEGMSLLEQILMGVVGVAGTVGAAVKATNTVRDGRRRARDEKV